MNRRGNPCLSVDERGSGRWRVVDTADVLADADGAESGALLAVTVRIIPAKPTMRMRLKTRRRHT